MTTAKLRMRSLPAIGSMMLVLAAPMVARAATAEEDFHRYHSMVHAAAVCAYPGLDIRGNVDGASIGDKMAADHAQELIAAKIDERAATNLSAAEKLFIISNARMEVNELIKDKSCDGDDVVALVQAYDDQIGVLP